VFTSLSLCLEGVKSMVKIRVAFGCVFSIHTFGDSGLIWFLAYYGYKKFYICQNRLNGENEYFKRKRENVE
jgi:hypothetical protein